MPTFRTVFWNFHKKKYKKLLTSGIRGGEFENVSILVAVGVSSDGHREILGAAEGLKEDLESWKNFFVWLKSRGLNGVRLVIGDKALGMVEAIGQVFPKAKYQRCIVHFYRNMFSVVPNGKVKEFTSYEAQIDYYTNYINSRDDWEFVSVYTDEGISGTGIKKRIGFQTMIDDALAGKIDLIVTKSVSRFARNTVDSLTTIRKLKENGIECYFEKENIWTFDGKGDANPSIITQNHNPATGLKVA